MSIIKKGSESNTISGENELVDGSNTNYIPHSVGLRIKTINPNDIKNGESIHHERYRTNQENYKSYHKDSHDINN